MLGQSSSILWLTPTQHDWHNCIISHDGCSLSSATHWTPFQGDYPLSCFPVQKKHMHNFHHTPLTSPTFKHNVWCIFHLNNHQLFPVAYPRTQISFSHHHHHEAFSIMHAHREGMKIVSACTLSTHVHSQFIFIVGIVKSSTHITITLLYCTAKQRYQTLALKYPVSKYDLWINIYIHAPLNKSGAHVAPVDDGRLWNTFDPIDFLSRFEWTRSARKIDSACTIR